VNRQRHPPHLTAARPSNRVSPSFDPGYYGYDAKRWQNWVSWCRGVRRGARSEGRGQGFHGSLVPQHPFTRGGGKRGGGGACGLPTHSSALRELGGDAGVDGSGPRWGSPACPGADSTSRAMLELQTLFTVGRRGSGMQISASVIWNSQRLQRPVRRADLRRIVNLDIADPAEWQALLVHADGTTAGQPPPDPAGWANG